MITDVHPLILPFRSEWQRNRHVVEGARSVRLHASTYIPPISGQDAADYEAYVARVPFFPAASRTHDGLVGLMFRKASTIKAPDAFTDILDTITPDGASIDDLAEQVASETITTNFVGLFVDHPISSEGVTMANAIQRGIRPFIAVYRAENILWAETGVVNNQQKLVRVVIQDCEESIRELMLIDGQYAVTEHALVDGQWVEVQNYIPTKNGQSLDEIPFTLVNTRQRRFHPSKAPLTDICDLNIQHYQASANVATCHWFAASPVHWVAGAEDAAYTVAPGTVWVFKQPTAKAEILEFKGTAVDSLRQAKVDIEQQMAQCGSRILAAEKVAAEAADTLQIRRASENASLANIARVISRKISEALKWVAWWLDQNEDDFEYELNTDFNSVSLTGPELLARLALYQNDAISLDALLDILIDSEILPEHFDKEADKELRQQEIDARPPVEALPSPVPGLTASVGVQPPVEIKPKAV